MKKVISTCLVLAITAIVSLAHEFWLLPSAWFVQPGQSLKMSLRVGEGFAGDPWEANASRVTQFFSMLGKTKTDRLGNLQKSGLDSLWLSFDKPGTQMVCLATNNKFLEMEADKFDAYLQEDGLEHIRKLRQQISQTSKPSREFYRRESASLIQVGDTPSKVFFEKTGFELRILPEKNPLLAESNSEMLFKIRFKGKSLAGALVRHWRKTADGSPIFQIQKSDRNGQVRFRLSPGEQMVSVVHMVAYPKLEEADWQSIWGNLTFCLK